MFKSKVDRVGKHFRIIRRLRRDRSGATMIEFAFVAAPFLAFTLAIIQVSLVYFGGFVLENAVDQASRMIRTGQAQTQGFDEVQFKQQICDRVPGMFDCLNGLKLDVQRFESFPAVDDGNFDPPLDGGQIDDSGFGFNPGNGGDIVLVRVFYVWDLIAAFPETLGEIRMGLSNIPGGSGRLLMATAAFRNEPFDG